MGYYVQIVSSSAVIPKANLQRAYEKMCALNVTHDHEKGGGSWSNGKQDGKWFAWMDANYPETCKDAQAVLEQLGFGCAYNDAGDLMIESYDSKTGQEDLFMKSIENDVAGDITWRGEEGEVWVSNFKGSMVLEAEPVTKGLTYSQPEEQVVETPPNDEKELFLGDEDGDGDISFKWNERNYGITVELTDPFGNIVGGCFTKIELKKLLRKVIKECK